jgi:hypothetical protein
VVLDRHARRLRQVTGVIRRVRQSSCRRLLAFTGSAKREAAERRTGVRRDARVADTNLTHRVRDGVEELDAVRQDKRIVKSTLPLSFRIDSQSSFNKNLLALL